MKKKQNSLEGWRKAQVSIKENLHLSVLIVEEWDTMHQNALLRKRKISLKGNRRTSLRKYRKRDN